MHRLITRAPKGKVVDHENGDGLDNRRANLRVCDHRQNRRNHQRPRKGGASRFHGVGWWKRDQKWRAKISVDGRTIHLGYFADEEDAARAYDQAAREHFGEYASTNF